MDFDTAFDELMKHEGGYVNHPSDPGRATRFGVTEKVARANGYTGDMRDLPIDLAKKIARRSYWDAVQADKLPAPLRYAVFDAAYNSGVHVASQWLQSALDVVADGRIGSITLAAAERSNPQKVLRKMLGWRLQYVAHIPTWPTFGKGWAKRIAYILMKD